MGVMLGGGDSEYRRIPPADPGSLATGFGAARLISSCSLELCSLGPAGWAGLTDLATGGPIVAFRGQRSRATVALDGQRRRGA